MKVILKQDVPKLGKKHEVKNVRRGFFLNFLLPRGMAFNSSPGAITQSNKLLETRRKRSEESRKRAEAQKTLLEGLVITFKRKISSKNKLYGSIGEKDIGEFLAKENDVNLAKEQIKMKSHIKTLGEHMVTIHLAEDVNAELKILVEEDL